MKNWYSAIIVIIMLGYCNENLTKQMFEKIVQYAIIVVKKEKSIIVG
jgi:hypothetical protein